MTFLHLALAGRPDLGAGYHPEYDGYPKDPKKLTVKQVRTERIVLVSTLRRVLCCAKPVSSLYRKRLTLIQIVYGRRTR